MNILYHITPRNNLESIITNGLLFNQPLGVSAKPYWKKENPNRIWLTNNPHMILENQCGEEWVDKNDPVILKIDVSSIRDNIRANIIWHKYIPTIVDYEFYSIIEIDPNLIIKTMHP